METETIFRIVLPLLIFAYIAHRGYYTLKHGREENTLKKRKEGLASKLAGLIGLISFVAILAYVINPDWVVWASLPIPIWLRWAGFGVALAGFALLQWAQISLGKSWSDTPRMIKDQTLVTNGAYRYIRHPIYSAVLLIQGSTLLISSNWLVGLPWIAMTVIEVGSRIKFEETLMIEFFGDKYRDYMKKTGRLFPRLIH